MTVIAAKIACGKTTALAFLAAGFTFMVPSAAAFHFTDVSQEAGITATYDQDPENFRALSGIDREYANMTGGAVAEDFDQDGWIDLFVLRGGRQPNLLYLNQGDGSFIEAAGPRGVAQIGRHAGVCGADYDSDGDVDLFVSALEGPHLLLTNDGSGHFTVDPDAIPRLSSNSSSPSWADLDGDGLLDLALGSWSDGTDGKDNSLKIYRNEGSAGFSLFQFLPVDWTFSPHFADLNGDGSPDLVAVADFGNTRFFLNDGRGILIPAGGSDIENGMGVATADLDFDGDLDLFMTSIQHPDPDLNVTNTTGNRLLLNDGHGEFRDVTTTSGIRSGYWGWGAVFADFENDGDQDLFHTNGFASFFFPPRPYTTTPAMLFENLGGLRFENVAESSGDAPDLGQGRGVVTFDYDRDGDLDLFIVNNNDLHPAEDSPTFTTTPGKLLLLRNDTVAKGHWLKVMIKGRAPHHAHGIGSRIEVRIDGKSQLREIHASTNFNGHGPYRFAHFGTGPASEIDFLRATFPNGDSVELEKVPVDREVTIASSAASVDRRQVALGGTLTFEMPAAAIPPAGEVIWSHDGIEQPNPATFTFTTPGPQTIRAQFFIDSSRSPEGRTETFAIDVTDPTTKEPTIARLWNDLALDAIRIDFPNPAVHARNLFHLSVAMWDAWAAYDPVGVGYLHREFVASEDPLADRREALSYAAYRLLSARYKRSTNASASQLRLDFLMRDLGYPLSVTTTVGDSAAALGNRIAATILDWGKGDGSLEENDYRDPSYRPANRPLILADSGTVLDDPNRWQPLQFEIALSQNGLFTLKTQIYAGSQWGGVRPFALLPSSTTYLDPGAPPRWGGPESPRYRQEALEVLRYSNRLDPDDGVVIDISPRTRGLNTLGSNDGNGHEFNPNPATGLPYQEQWVKRADYGRVIAEYWADGPDSETPPGHWNSLANKVTDHPALQPRFRGTGEDLDPLEWQVKLYFALNAALHDAAVAAWDCKHHYDYVRPISSIRFLSQLGELPERPGLIEEITAESSAPGERHASLVEAGAELGETAILVWGGEPSDPERETTGNQWILGKNWLPYQRSTFVTPAFAGYVSGHSTFSRAAAEVLAEFTGTPYFPGGLGHHFVPAGSLEFEWGPSTDLILQWATYFDAADEAGLSRLYGGIHFPVDDGPGRIMGSIAGKRAMALAAAYFDGSILARPIPIRLTSDAHGPSIRGRLTRGMHYRLESSFDLSSWRDERPPFRALSSSLAMPLEKAGPRRFFRLRSDEPLSLSRQETN